MKRRRVKITGIGPVTPLGIGRSSFLSALLSGESKVRSIKRFIEEAGPFIAAEVSDFSPEHLLHQPILRKMPRHTQFALVAVMQALADAKIGLGELASSKIGLHVGAALMDFGPINRTIDLISRKGPIAGLPSAIASASPSSIASAIAKFLKMQSVASMTYQSACCSGIDAIGHGLQAVLGREVDIAICGGTEAPLFLHPMLELRMAGLSSSNQYLPENQCRPFDLWRTTGAIGEGSCMLVLEPNESPRKAYAYIDGYASAGDYKETPCSGLFHAMKECLSSAAIAPSEVEAISAWGPGHREIDKQEARAIRLLFESSIANIPVYSIKGAIGNPLGAAGAIQAGAAACCIDAAVIPPTVNWSFRDPDCNLNLSSVPRAVGHKNCLVNTHGISGANSCLLISQ